MAIEIRPLQDNETELANNFFNRVYGTDRPLESFRWEFVNGPKGKAIYVIAVDTSSASTKIVGIQCAIPLEFVSARGVVTLTAKSEDTLVDPSYRGQKLFERMYDLLFAECKKAGIQYIWGFTPALKAFERIGFTAPFRTSQAVFVCKPISAYKYLVSLNTANKFGDKVKIAGLSYLSWLKGLITPLSTSAKVTLLSSHLNTTVELQQFSEPQANYVFIAQDEAYTKWRLLDNPYGNNYINLKIDTAGNKSSYVLVNIRDRVSYIEQVFFCLDLSASEKVTVIKSAVRKLQQEKVSLVRTLCFTNNAVGKELIDLLKQAGFVYLDRGNYFVWKVLDPEDRIQVDQLVPNRLFTQGNS